MNHVRNGDRTSMDDVLASFETWNQKHQETTQETQERQEAYRNKHEDPRTERGLAYIQYLQEKHADFTGLSSKAPSSQRMQELKQWFARHPLPENLKNGLQTDLIYTSR